MNWIDDSRREAFERSERVRAESRTGHVKTSGMVGDLDRILLDEIKKRAVKIGNELTLSYEDALAAVAFATEHQIAVLGFDSGEIVEDGFRVVDYSGYDRDFKTGEDWNAYVVATNTEADRWIKEHPLGRNHGYVLISSSQEEFLRLPH